MVKKFSALLKEGRLGGNYENSESNNGIPVIKMGNLGRGEININKVQFLPEDIEYNKEDVLIKGDLLFNTRNTLELVGKVSIWREELPFALYNSNLMRMKFNNEIETSNVFMNYYFNTKNSINQLRRFATGTTSVAAIYGKDLKGFNVAFPTLPEQQKIASFLSAVDEKIQQLSRKKELVEQYKKGVMQQLFSEKLRFKDENEKEYPEWEKKKLGDLVKIKSGNSPSDYNFIDDGVNPFIKVEELNNCSKYQNKSRFYSNNHKNLIESFSVIFPKRGAAILNNKVRINDCPILMDSNMMALIPFRKVLDVEFLYSKIVMAELYKIADTSSIPQINNKHIEPFVISTPCLEEQQKIANFLSGIDGKIEQVNGELVKTQEFKKGLLQQMFV
ncbi:hypothetical protein G7A72_16385 [Flavobacterium sp. Sr18]|uniref:restriction endonuclease subunit S n=1 Tax=Flavobacterium sp. Sr18 TaxID=935222 RepID=UPI0013E4CEA2|nr:restriction endonuclease subunit S [Flavobacterium sp. Sr18]QIH40288.1 hypothetical protein G7A72_16385 [Flavobacterium sp. Sr18]